MSFFSGGAGGPRGAFGQHLRSPRHPPLQVGVGCRVQGAGGSHAPLQVMNPSAPLYPSHTLHFRRAAVLRAKEKEMAGLRVQRLEKQAIP